MAPSRLQLLSEEINKPSSPRLQLISEKIIKPSSPTPLSLKSYKLSLMDQLTEGDYIPIVSFFPRKGHNTSHANNQISNLLENSLSKVLTSYYPFAGTIKDNVSINCDDRGVTFIETRINCKMPEILRNPDARAQDILFPRAPWSPVENEKPLLAQLNHFDCGGKALGVSMSHKLGDGYTMARFLSDWAAVTRQPTEELTPQFIGDSIFPGKNTSIAPVFGVKRDDCLAKWFSFNAKSIAKLKELVTAESGVQNPTRVEVVTAFLYKCAAIASMVHSQSFKPLAFLQHVNLRRVTKPPLHVNSIGNMWYFFIISIANEGAMKLSRLVSKLRKGKLEFYEKCQNMNLDEIPTSGIEMREEQMKNDLQDVELYASTSLCGFPTNELEFGWGRPTRVSVGAGVTNNGFLLMDDHDGDGVNAMVVLDEKVMSIFENDKEVLQFSSPNLSFQE